MPAQFKIYKPDNRLFIKHTCEVKGCENYASFGFDADIKEAYRTLNSKSVQSLNERQKALGRWYCGKHKPLA